MGRSHNIKADRLSFLLPLLTGLAAFFLVVGPRVLDTSNIAWLGEGDPVQHFLGWQFFRQTPWTFPIGLNPGYGLELSNAIVFSDSNPLLAFLFKPLAPLLPATFQYFGIWLLLCFLLQSWFGWKLAGLFSANLAIRTLCACLFIFSPPMLWRLHGHFSLVSHFLILAALYFSLHPDLPRRRWCWATLLAMSALVHAYLLTMALLLWLADIARQVRAGKCSASRALRELAPLFCVLALVCWQAGYFSVRNGAAAEGFGYHRLNLLSVFDPSGWSYLLPDLPEGPGDYEGFNFLGLGNLFLAVCMLPVLLDRRPGVIAIRRHWSLLLVLVGLAVFAASNKIGIGAHEYQYHLPRALQHLGAVFRASGRMFWPAFYGIVFFIVSTVVRANSARTAGALLALACLLQVIDTSAAWKEMRMHLMAKPGSQWSSPLGNRFWIDAANKYKKVRTIPPRNQIAGWQFLADYAARHRMGTNAVYLARIDTKALDSAAQKAQQELDSGTYEADTLYILDDGALAQALPKIRQDADLVARIDGFNVLAPGWKSCARCPPVKN
jgi:hypothetical protein